MAAPAIGTPTLIGVGVGPGDPELVTVKAVAVFESADVILVPATEASGQDAGRAEQVVLAACPAAAAKLQRVPFSMAQRSGIGTKRRQSWMASAKAAQQAFADGASIVAFATVGDPSVYSTFSYLAAQVRAVVPGLTVVVVPGITAMQALAAASVEVAKAFFGRSMPLQQGGPAQAQGHGFGVIAVGVASIGKVAVFPVHGVSELKVGRSGPRWDSAACSEAALFMWVSFWYMFWYMFGTSVCIRCAACSS